MSEISIKSFELTKVYYSIGEVAQMFDVNNSLIRFWETQFDFIRPKKNAKGNRKFTQDDLKKLKLVYHLVKEKGYTLQGAQDHIKSSKDSIDDTAELVESLQRVRSFLEEMKRNLP